MKKTVKNSLIYMSGTALMGIIGFMSSILLTRLLIPEVYAQYGLLLTFSSASTTILSFGLDESYRRFYYSHKMSQGKYILMCIVVPLILTAVFIFAFVEPSHFIAKQIFGDTVSVAAVLFVAIYILFTVLHRFGQSMARMGEHPYNFVISSLIERSGFLIVIVALIGIFKNISFEHIAISYALSAAVAVLINLFVLIKLKNAYGLGETEVNNKILFRYGLPFLINNGLALVIPVIQKLMIRELSGWVTLGIYTAASGFSTVISLISVTVSNIWTPLVYKHCGNESLFKPILYKMGYTITMIMTVGLTACIMLRRWLVLILASDYYSVYVIAPAILFASGFHMISEVCSVGINIRAKTSILALVPVIQAAFSVGFSYLLIPSLGLVGAGIAYFAGIISSRLFRIIVGFRVYKPWKKETKAYLLWTISIGAAMLSMFFTSLWADLIIGSSLIVLGCVVVNKDGIGLLKDIKTLLQSNKKEKKAEENE